MAPAADREALRHFLWLLAMASAFALLLACTNVAHLLIVRGFARKHELSVRLALGAERGRILFQSLAENLLIFLLGGAAGLLIAGWCLQAADHLPLAAGVRVQDLDVGLDGPVVLFAAGMTLLTGLVFGLIPGWRAAHADLRGALSDRAASLRSGRGHVRGALLAAQTAICFGLLAGTLVFVHSMRRELAIDPGFHSERLVSVGLDLGMVRYGRPEAEAFYRSLLDRLGGLAGLESVTLSRAQPFSSGAFRTAWAVDGYVAGPDEDMDFEVNAVGPEYFATLGIRMLEGRDFTLADAAGGQRVAVVNAELARRFWGGRGGLDKRLRMLDFGGQELLVVGVAENVKIHTLREDPQPYVYVPALQHSYLIANQQAYLLYRTGGSDPLAILSEVRGVVRELAPSLPILTAARVDEILGELVAPQRFAAMLLGFLGLLALFLTLVGVVGLVGYLISQRRFEIGLRLALGAPRHDLTRLILRQVMIWSAAGLGAGLFGYLFAIRALTGLVYMVSIHDPLALLLTAAAVTATVTAAAFLTARRWTRLDPMRILRTG